MQEDGYAFQQYMASPMPNFDEDSARPGRAVVGWLKIKEAMRWGFFIRKKAAESRAQLVELGPLSSANKIVQSTSLPNAQFLMSD
ncbi:hypothetical protein K1719_011327 [Acacia pycnantha]|nr:hypothetical protein K1719_011327 [Acacia pycnantha]